ncbi:glycosyltransferase family 2 protein [Haloarchaeobius litoreus]|uniref:Glycosyltransferase family 2 protein n=1 Tax=Haloarchaeobius litoreus TaxID=755306 RepID=A0ABD6DP34_9EURY|nr:glycosyltransferase family 2 protein [Haloarchaeobius litoreus]
MYEGQTIGVVVPAYDEEGFVGDVIESVPTSVDRVYAVDDHSTDGTFREMREAAATWNEREDGPTVDTIRHERNRGVGGAIKTGYLRARQDRTDVTVVMAGDGQMEVEIFDRLLDPIVSGDAAYVKANRFASDDDIRRMPRLRRFGNRVLEFLTRIASGYWSTGDPQSGYTAISLEALDTVDIDNLYEYYGYCNELLVRLNAREFRVVDVPRPVTYGEEQSGISLGSYVPRVSAMLLRSFIWRLKVRYLDRRVRDVPGLYVLGCCGIVLAALARGLGRSERTGRLARNSMMALVLAMLLDRARNGHLDDINSEPSKKDSE